MKAHVPMVKLKCPVFVRRSYCLYQLAILGILVSQVLTVTTVRSLLTPLIDNQWRTSASGSNSGIQLAPVPQSCRPFVSVLLHLQITESVENCAGCFRSWIVRNVTGLSRLDCIVRGTKIKSLAMSSGIRAKRTRVWSLSTFCVPLPFAHSKNWPSSGITSQQSPFPSFHTSSAVLQYCSDLQPYRNRCMLEMWGLVLPFEKNVYVKNMLVFIA